MTHNQRWWVEVDLDCLQNNLLWIRHCSERSALSFHRRVSYVKWISKGTSLGCARTFTANHKIQIATVASDDGFDHSPLIVPVS